MKNIMLGEEAKKSVGNRLEKTCRTDGLVFRRLWMPLWVTMSLCYKHFLRWMMMQQLLKKMMSIQFLDALYILKAILLILAQLSKYFQKDVISFSAINPAVKLTKDKIKEIQETEEPLEKLKVDADSFTIMCGDNNWNVRDSEYLHKLLTNYTNALIENIDDRFNDSIKLLSAFGFKEYGNFKLYLPWELSQGWPKINFGRG